MIKRELYEFIYNHLRKHKLTEMARNRERCIDGITGLQSKLAEHMAKLVCLVPTSTTDYWREEIINNYIEPIDDMCDVTFGTGRAPATLLFPILWTEPLGNATQMEKIFKKNSYKAKYDPRVYRFKTDDVELMHNELKEMYENICLNLSINNVDGIIDMIKNYDPMKILKD